MENPDLHGRFLPSRVFSRWKWTVRFGLLIVPLVLFIAGSLQLYFSPSRYLSRTVFEITNGPSLRETEELLRSENVLSRVSEKLELPDRLGLDRDNCVAIIRKNLESHIPKDTRMIRLDVTMNRGVDARDVAEEIPRAVVAYLADSLRARSNEKIIEFKRLESVEIDRAKELSTRWIKLQEVHGENPSDPGAVIAIERARAATLRSEAQVAGYSAIIRAEDAAIIENKPRLAVHSPPTISNTPVTPETVDELGALALTCLAWALGTALLLPYLFELAFPPAAGLQKTPAPVIDL